MLKPGWHTKRQDFHVNVLLALLGAAFLEWMLTEQCNAHEIGTNTGILLSVFVPLIPPTLGTLHFPQVRAILIAHRGRTSFGVLVLFLMVAAWQLGQPGIDEFQLFGSSLRNLDGEPLRAKAFGIARGAVPGILAGTMLRLCISRVVAPTDWTADPVRSLALLIWAMGFALLMQPDSSTGAITPAAYTVCVGLGYSLHHAMRGTFYPRLSKQSLELLGTGLPEIKDFARLSPSDQRRVRKAVDRLRQSLPESARKLLTTLDDKAGTLVGMLTALAQAQLLKHADAIDTLEIVLEQPNRDKTYDAALYCMLGNLYLARGQADRAKAAFDEALKLVPMCVVSEVQRVLRDLEALRSNPLAARLDSSDSSERIARATRRALEPVLSPIVYIVDEAFGMDGAFFKSAIGYSYLAKGDYEGAATLFTSALTINPHHVAAHVYSGELMLVMASKLPGSDQERYVIRARAHLHVAIELERNQPNSVHRQRAEKLLSCIEDGALTLSTRS